MSVFTLKKNTRLAFILAAGLCLGGCTDLRDVEQRVLTGTFLGTAVGAVGMAATGGCVSCGAWMGAAAGAVGGYVYDWYNRDD